MRYLATAGTLAAVTALALACDDPAGSGPELGGPALERAPLSHPGGKIAYSANDDGRYQIYVASSDGSDVIQLTDNDYLDYMPRWSSNGRKIVFRSNRHDDNPDCQIHPFMPQCNAEIYVMNADGSGQTRLTDNDVWDTGASWSPDGKKIAFYHDGGIHVMNADGTEQQSLDAPGNFPDYSRNGKRILFDSARDDGDNEIYVMAADGSEQTRLTNSPGLDRFPVWSPDGKKIAFTSERDSNSEIYVMNADGTEQMRLTQNDATDSSPTWSQNGELIVFASNRGGNSQIWVINADGSGEALLLVATTGRATWPDWGRGKP